MSIDSSSRPLGSVSVGVARPAPERATSRRKRGAYGKWIGLGLIALVIALVASTFRRGAFTYSKYVDEVMGQPDRWVGREIRVDGMVQSGSLEHREGSRHYHFVIERNNRTMEVDFDGEVPDAFRAGAGVTVRGRLQRDHHFVATEIAARCPSKYEMQAQRARGQQGPASVGAHAR